MLVLLKPLGTRRWPSCLRAPNMLRSREEYGTFIEKFSLALARHLEPDGLSSATTCCDLALFRRTARGRADGIPEARVREMRMNMGTQHWNIRKSRGPDLWPVPWW